MKKNQTLKHVYLSIDLDFWSDGLVDKAFLTRVIQQVGAADVASAVQHDNLLPHAMRYADCCRTHINLDKRSDLGGTIHGNFVDENGIPRSPRRPELHFWSWADYIPWATKKEFIWGYPSPKRQKSGHCCDHLTDDTPSPYIPQRPGQARSWQRVRCYLAKAPDYGIPLEKVRAASITLSPVFCGS